MRWGLFAMAIAMPGYGWVHTYEWMQAGYSVQQTKDSGYVVTGATWGEMNVPDIGIIKTDANGDMIWTRTYGRTGNDEGRCIRQTKDGGYIIVGSVDGVELSPGRLWLLKTDANGDTVWAKMYGYMFGEDEGYWVEETSDGGYIITGTSNPTGGMNNRLWLLKTDDNGDTLWTQTYIFCSHGYCVRQTIDGGYIIASSWGLIKTNSLGDTLWTNFYPSGCVEQTTDGGYIQATSHNKDVWLIKTDSNGDTLWTSTYGGDDEEYSYDVQQTSDGGYVIVGETWSFGPTRGDAYGWLLKTDANGDTIWTRILGGGRGYSVQQTIDGGYIISGSFGGGFLGLIKTDSLGYAGIEEQSSPPPALNWEVISSIGPTVTLRYENHPQGFRASVYDALGRRVDEIGSSSQSGTITWGEGWNPGVYFIRSASDSSPATQKVILLK